MTRPPPAGGGARLEPVLQRDRTGCGLASVAALAGRDYAAVRRTAARLGIRVADPALWRRTEAVRRLLAHYRIAAAPREEPFTSWRALPPRALLAIKWHRTRGVPAWHWVVFVRDAAGCRVLDPKRALRRHRRTDFGRMKPKWFIAVGGRTGRPAAARSVARAATAGL